MVSKYSIAAVVLATGLFGAMPATAQVSGEQLFKQRCATCHAIKANAASVLGPNLAGVVGRKAGVTNYKYTPALKMSKIVWAPSALDKYLAAPAKMVPGTRMVIAVSDPKQREALVGYLKTVR